MVATIWGLGFRATVDITSPYYKTIVPKVCGIQGSPKGHAGLHDQPHGVLFERSMWVLGALGR